MAMKFSAAFVQLVVPVFVEDGRLGRRSRLRGDYEQAMIDIDLIAEPGNHVRVG
jgi:hypothetical protein